MVRKLLMLLLAAFLAWQYGWVIYGLISTANPWDHHKYDGGFFAAFAITTVCFWILIKLLALLMGFFWPASQRYGATKPMRRFQNASAQVIFFLIFLAFFTAAATIADPADDDFRAEIAHRIAPDVIKKIVDPLKATLSAAESELAQHRSELAPYEEPLSAAKQDYVNTLRALSIEVPPGRDISPHLFEELIPPFQLGNPTWALNRQYNIDHYFAARDENLAKLQDAFNQKAGELLPYTERVTSARQALEDAQKRSSAGADMPEVQKEAAAVLEGKPFLWKFFKTLANSWPPLALFAAVAYVLFVSFGKRPTSALYEPVRNFLDAGGFGIGGSSRLATLFEEWGLGWRRGNGELFMGRSLYSRFLHIGIKDDRHMLTIAGSRGGKGTTAIIPNLLTWEGSVLVIDPKGTNAAVTAQMRARNGSVHIVDPFNVLGSGASASFNPLAMLDPNSREIREQIAVIAEALVVPDPEAKDKHWDDGARTVISGLIAHLITAYENPDLSHLRDLLNLGEDEQTALWADMSANDGAGGAAKEAAKRIIRGIGTPEISGILSNADKHTEWLASAPIQDALRTTTFAFAEMKETPTTIYLILPPHYLDTHNRFLRLFVNLAIKQMSVSGRSKIPVLMILDEFLALGHMAEVEKALGLMAGYNFVLWPFVQDLGRLKDLYKNSVNSFINNSRAVQIFAISDEVTTKFVSDRIGQRSLSTVLGMGSSARAVPLRTPTEVAREVSAESNFEYILRAGKPPLLLEKVRYFEDATAAGQLPLWLKRRLFPFRGLYDKDPDYN